MSKRPRMMDQVLQAAQLSSPTLETPADPAAEARRTATQKRTQGLMELGRVTKYPVVKIKASECSIWEGNGRNYEALNENRLRKLIDSILNEGGNKIPIVVRRTNDTDKPYQVIAGTRRHWSVAWLNANHYPEIELLANVVSYDDETAFRVADLENRARDDMSDFERAINYKEALERYYGGKQKDMADRLRVPTSTLWRYLLLAQLPPEIIAAFATPDDILVSWAEKLHRYLKIGDKRALMMEEAAQIALDQSFLIAEDETPIGGSEVVKRLINATTAKEKSSKSRSRRQLEGENGEIFAVVKSDSVKGFTISFLPSNVPVKQQLASLQAALEQARIRAVRS